MVEEHPLHHPMVEGSNTTHGTDRKIHNKLYLVGNLVGCSSMVEENPLHHPMVEGSNPTHGNDREKHKKLDLFGNLVSCGSILIEQSLHHPKVEGSNPTHGTDKKETWKFNWVKKLAAVAGGRTPTSSSKGWGIESNSWHWQKEKHRKLDLVRNLVGCSSMVEGRPFHHPKVEGLHPTHGTDREKHKKLDLIGNLVGCGSMVEEHPFHHPKVEGLNPTQGTDREKNTKSYIWQEIWLW
jgi:hypothetical protein